MKSHLPIKASYQLPSVLQAMTAIVAAMIALLPFHAFLTVWASSVIGHYTLLRLWKDILLGALVVGCLIVAARTKRWPASWQTLRRRPLLLISALYILLLLVSGLVALRFHDVSVKAFADGLLLDGRFVLFFGVCYMISQHSGWIGRHYLALVLVPASIVVVFGILQFTVLPANFLSHFGYGPHTIAAVETVDQKSSYQRIQSTLRGANPLGAYLIIIMSLLSGLLLRRPLRRWRYAVLLLGSIAALAMTYSRSAYIGAIIACGWLLWHSITSRQLRRRLVVTACLLVVCVSAAAVLLRNNDVFQNTVFHRDTQSKTAGSDQGHLAASRAGLSNIVHQPFGGGTGTAGPASVYNNHPARIAEDYFIQIGQEAGVIGLGLFIAINVLVAKRLWQRRDQLLAQVLLASLIGISFVNLLSHAWSDDTLSYIWWGLAGAACALPLQAISQASVNKNDKATASRPSDIK